MASEIELPPPKPTGIHAAWNTILNWREVWLWPGVALLQLYLLIKLATVLTGHPPQEGAEALVGLGFNILLCTVAISLVSIFRESTGIWWTKEQLLANPILSVASTFGRVIVLGLFLYALSHG